MWCVLEGGREEGGGDGDVTVGAGRLAQTRHLIEAIVDYARFQRSKL